MAASAHTRSRSAHGEQIFPLLSGGQLVVAALRAHGVDMAFSVAGESYLEVLDALFDAPEIRLVTCRQEGGAAFMAEAYGKLTGKPGVLLVTRGPGACNASIGIHTAFQDSTPMVVLVGQVARHQIDREAFQEVDFRRMFGAARQMGGADRHGRARPRTDQPGVPGRDLRPARPGRAGVARRHAARPPRGRGRRPLPSRCARIPAPPISPNCAACSPRPSARSCWSAAAGGATPPAATSPGLPRPTICRSCCSFRRQDIVDNRRPCFVGDLGTGAAPALVARVKEADLVLAVGARIGEITSQSYSLLGIPDPGKALIHVHPAAEELGRVFRPTLAIQSGMPEFAAAAAALEPVRRRSAGRAGAPRCAANTRRGSLPSPATGGGALDLGAVMSWLRERLPDDAIVTSDAGNFSGWPNRFLQYRRPGRQLGPTSGAMGYGVPAAVAAKLVHPERLVVGFCGDGGFMMTGQELATSLAEGVGPIILLFNNAMYGTIRMHQERRFPGRVVGTALKNPDFVALARAYGAFAARVARTEEFAPAFEEAAAARRAAVIELRMDPEMITTRTTLSGDPPPGRSAKPRESRGVRRRFRTAVTCIRRGNEVNNIGLLERRSRCRRPQPWSGVKGPARRGPGDRPAAARAANGTSARRR